MNRPKHVEYPIIYCEDDEIKIANCARQFPSYIDNYITVRSLVERSKQYRTLNKNNIDLKKYFNIISQILFEESSDRDKLRKIKNTTQAIRGLHGTKAV